MTQVISGKISVGDEEYSVSGSAYDNGMSLSLSKIVNSSPAVEEKDEVAPGEAEALEMPVDGAEN